MLTERFSPEQVAGRLRLEHPEDVEMQVSHETIYQALYVQGRGSLRLEVATALRSGRARRRRQKPDGPKAGRFQGMVMISDRPAEIEDRAVAGHWEGDLIIGSTSTRSAIGTLVERTSGFLMLLHLPGDHTALTVSTAMIEAMNTLPEQLRRSVTWGRGREMAEYQEITMATGMPIYFCDPHSPWQRGSSEVATRTPMGCCGNISRRAPACPSMGPGSWTMSPRNSTQGPGNVTAAAPPQKSSPSYSRTSQIKPVLRPPPEFAGYGSHAMQDTSMCNLVAIETWHIARLQCNNVSAETTAIPRNPSRLKLIICPNISDQCSQISDSMLKDQVRVQRRGR